MTRTWNFSAGPAALPTAVLERAREELLDYAGLGASVMEISHRSAVFDDVADRSEAALRRLLGLGEDHAVLFLTGGATQQFSIIPMALADANRPGAYEVHGHWGRKAAREAIRQGRGVVVAEGEPGGPIPSFNEWRVPDAAAYLHLTSNETIDGTQFPDYPATDVPLVADLSSDILSRPLDADRFGVMYASAQKNLGPAGITVVVVRRPLLERLPDDLPPIFDWRRQDASGSRLNTPPTGPWYLLGLVLEWLEEEGGVAAMGRRNEAKARLLYQAIDDSDWYRNTVPSAFRSRMNVPFRLGDPDLEPGFVTAADEAGLLGLKGHRSVGGLRASIYNAMPLEGVEALVSFMRDFEQRHA